MDWVKYSSLGCSVMPWYISEPPPTAAPQWIVIPVPRTVSIRPVKGFQVVGGRPADQTLVVGEPRRPAVKVGQGGERRRVGASQPPQTALKNQRGHPGSGQAQGADATAEARADDHGAFALLLDWHSFSPLSPPSREPHDDHNPAKRQHADSQAATRWTRPNTWSALAGSAGQQGQRGDAAGLDTGRRTARLADVAPLLARPPGARIAVGSTRRACPGRCRDGRRRRKACFTGGHL